MHKISQEIKTLMQESIDLELKKRKWIYFAPQKNL
jgi:hypothetical protein